MKLVVQCDHCGAIYTLGHIQHLPQPTRMLNELADIYHGHQCKDASHLAKVC
jgi:hypothetical protein